MRIMQEMSLMEKLNILSDAAKYDVACTSSGSNRRGDGKGMVILTLTEDGYELEHIRL